ncbi:hypothetical protein DICSQDRAFT_133362 [Dichomitus squalens LYAD-421 SS1]|uniref:uncharacterized protein n=1 Tax=Dichomitus squalens (strain LYAD-421) TaxID=732165 RepID=UPI0004415C5D|nr:uncharacterized protein DICSQDRAFT_133362 [Dichomitus squalens LYAD-421 SS1]EJF64629.1 hypothetical protein DICSQDRAFT_133362 [Dichomitus squalens LYAD-421 SS1]
MLVVIKFVEEVHNLKIRTEKQGAAAFVKYLSRLFQDYVKEDGLLGRPDKELWAEVDCSTAHGLETPYAMVVVVVK